MSVLGRLAPPGSFLWLTRHEMRVAARGLRKHSFTRYLGYALIALYVAGGCVAAAALQNVEIRPWPAALTGVLTAAIVMMSFMTTQAVLHSQRTLYESGDLDLLFSAPIPGEVILRAKLAAIAGTVMLSFAILVLPVALPVAALGHPGLFGIPLLLIALAMLAACLGLAITLVLARIAGPRAARTVGQIVAALLGGALFLFSQFSRDHHGGRVEAVFESLEHSGFGSAGLSGIPGQAAFGDPIALFILLGLALLAFWIAGLVLERLFLRGFQDGGVRLSRARASGRPVRRHFRRTLFGTVFAKEFTLLARDPALAFQMLLRLIYLAPLLLAFGHGAEGRILLPGLALASVAVAGQLVGSLAWLTVSAEDTPDLLTVAPVDKAAIGRAKLAAALAMAAPVVVLLPIGLTLDRKSVV